MRADFKAEFLEFYADGAASRTIERIALHMLENPDKYPVFNAASSKVIALNQSCRSVIGENAGLIHALSHAHHERSHSLAVEMYKQGLIDGGRLYHAMVNSELPVKGDKDEQ